MPNHPIGITKVGHLWRVDYGDGVEINYPVYVDALRAANQAAAHQGRNVENHSTG